MASPFLLLLLPLALSQFQPPYSYSPSYYTTQTSPTSPFFTSRFTSFTPYTNYPSVSYLRSGFRNQNLENVFSSYRSPSYPMQRTGKMIPNFSTQRRLINHNQRRGYSQTYTKPSRNMNRAPKSVQNFYPAGQIRTPLIPALPKPEVTPAWQATKINWLHTCHLWLLVVLRINVKNLHKSCKYWSTEEEISRVSYLSSSGKGGRPRSNQVP